MSISREVLAKFVTRGCHFVETGTKWGDTCIRAFELGARAVVTVERDMLQQTLAWLHLNDAMRGKGFFCRESDSVSFLRDYALTTFFKGDIVVFLDAHTDTECPVLEELATIGGWTNAYPPWREKMDVRPAVILVDDVRLFRSNHWGITLEQVIEAIDKIGKYEYSFETGAEPEDILVARRIG